jgi:imidazolonepropionase-like amidohydrolase
MTMAHRLHPASRASMLRAPSLFASLALLSFLPGCGESAQRPLEPLPGAAPGTVAFVGVGVLPMDGTTDALRDRTVLVGGGRIQAVGPAGSVEVPGDARVVDGEGLWLLPGLAEMHAHVPGPGTPDGFMEDLLFLYLANGVTTIRSMAGAPNHLELREALGTGRVLGPTLFSASPSLNGNSAPDPESAAELVRAHADAGYDLLKLHPGLSRESYDRMVEVAREVGITWAGHVSPAVGLEHSLATGKSTIDHLDGYLEAAASPEIRARMQLGEAVPLSELVAEATPERLVELARTTRDAGTWNVPTLYLWENFYNDVPAADLAGGPEMRYAAAPQITQWTNQKEGRVFVELLENWRTDGTLGAADVSPEDARALIQLRRDILAALHREGAGLLMGTDSPQMFMVPGFAVHHEIRVMAEAGVPPLAILESGTRKVGAYAASDLRHDQPFGSVVRGARADLVLVEGNPLEDLHRLRDPVGVMVRGRWIPRDEIRERLEAISGRMAEIS